MISKIIFFIATLCIVNASVNTIGVYDADVLSKAPDAVNDEPENFGLNLNEDVEALSIGADTVNYESENFSLNLIENVEETTRDNTGTELNTSDSPNEERIRICRFNICNRVCRVLKLKGKCVKKRCKCIPKGLSLAADTVNDEPENFSQNLNGDVEEPVREIYGPKLDSADFSNEERIRLCRSNSTCNRVCRVLNLSGKCVKKRCKCFPKATSMLEAMGFMVSDEVENPSLITDE